MPEPNSLLVLGIDPGPTRPAALAAWTVLSLDAASGTVGVRRQPAHLSKAALAELLQSDPLLSDPCLRLAALAAPMTPSLLERKPWKARTVEIRLSRGAFSGVARGPWMPWVSSSRTWPRYQRTARLQAILESHGLPLFSMPDEERNTLELPSRCLVEVYPKATLALLSSRAPLSDRPAASQFLGELDDWLFPRLFADLEASVPPIQNMLGLRLRLAPEVLEEARRIARLRRPFPRREPMRAFIAAFQGILALRGWACLVGAPGEREGSILLPAAWHPDWEAEWSDTRRSVPEIRRVLVRHQSTGSAPLAALASTGPNPGAVEMPSFAAQPLLSDVRQATTPLQ